MYRFKVSKYKNAAPKVPKKEDTIQEIPLGQIMASCGNFVTVSGKHIAFNVESGAGGCAGVLPLDYVGRRNTKVPTVYAHGEFMTDMAFSPFDDDLLATCSYDGHIKLWVIPENFEDILDNPLLSMKPDEATQKLEIINFHPTADEILACSAYDGISIIDLNEAVTKSCIVNGTESQFQSMSWKYDGTMLVTSCKDTKNRILDPRAEKITQTFDGFQGKKDSRVTWLGNTDYILGSGFNKQRKRMIGLWDVRTPDKLIFEQEMGTGSGVLMPFHDIDTNLIILAGKGDNIVSIFELNESTTNLTFNSSEMLSQQTFGLGVAPKRILNVMQGEVIRAYQLAKNTIVPLPYIVPRKSYRDFHADLFPDTVYSGEAAMDGKEWFSGVNKEGIKLNLDPQLGNSKPRVSGLKAKKLVNVPSSNHLAEKIESKDSIETSKVDSEVSKSNEITTVNNEDLIETENIRSRHHQQRQLDTQTSKPKLPKGGLKMFRDMYQPKFKHLLGEVLHKSNNIENIKNIAESLPSESDAFEAYEDIIVVPLSGPGGQLAVFQLSKPGRLPESDIPVLQNGSGVLDFAIDPFDNKTIAVGCEDWKIRLWRIPEEGLTVTLEEPFHILKGHQQRVTIVKYHPTAKDILVSAATDFTVRVWDLNDHSEIGSLEGHTDQIFCLAWHPDGKLLATFCKDKKIRLYDPVEDIDPKEEGDGPETSRGARMCWCGPNNNWLVISTTHSDGRRLHLYDSENLQHIASTDVLDNSPSMLSLHYDEASATVFATGKGDRTIVTFEVHEKKPYFHRLADVQLSDTHMGVTYLRKDLVDVRKVEFMRAVRLTKSCIELLSFTVPRVKSEFFQDDLFPDVRVTWKPLLSSEEWLDGNEARQNFISLQPSDMKKLSEVPKEAPKASKYDSSAILSEKTDEEKKAELINAMMNKLDVDERLEQDDFEGVDEEEWDE